MREWWARSRPLIACISFGQEFFGEFWTNDGGLDLRRSDHRDLFERSVTGNLADPYVCSEHRVGHAMDDIEFFWGDLSGSIVFPTCCERAGRQALIKMLTFAATDQRAVVGRPHRLRVVRGGSDSAAS